jgi:acetylornithine deacetylase/succinyl-diaminopimelate desuccinylase-like protein
MFFAFPGGREMSEIDTAIEYAHAHEKDFLGELQELLRIPSISTLPENQADVMRAAEWVADQLRETDHSGVEILFTARHPVVYGEWLGAGADAPMLLIYGHYDVQPVDPIDEWDTPPFAPEIRGENIFARGAADMKGQLVEYLKAVESINAGSVLPLNVKYLLEGEEEIGSPSLEAFINENAERYASDLCLNLDSGILAADLPSISYGLRGMAYFEIRLAGAKTDLHSGAFGGVVDNPGQVLCELIAGMRNREGRVLLPGFYAHVRELTERERADLAALPQDEEWWLEQADVPALFGEPGFSPTERATARPTLDVNGLLCGFTGEGSKTVLPARAMAKISMRLVPDQDPADVRESLTRYLHANVPETMEWELIGHAQAMPAIIDRDSAAVESAVAALRQVWGKEPLFKREGGTVPVVSLIKQKLGIDTLLFGFSLPDAHVHGPNEKLHIPTFHRGVDAFVYLMYELADRIQPGER